jgi:hypothetical protein
MSALPLVVCCCSILPAQTSGQPVAGSRRARLQSRFANPASPSIPLTSGNWSQLGELVLSANQPIYGGGEYFGQGVAIDGNTIVVSTGATTIIPAGEAAYVFEKPVTGWRNMVPNAILSTPGTFNGLAGLALSGDTVAVCQTNGLYVFVKPSTGWANMEPTAVLSTTDNAYCDIVYGTLSMSGDTIVMGNFEAGEAYVFVKPAAGWANMTQTAKLTASDGQKNSLFGYATSISGNTIMVGSPGAGTNVTGKVYAYVEPPTGWVDMTETAQLTVPGVPQKAEVGTGVSLDGDTALVSSYAHTAYIFTKPAGSWVNTTPTAALTSADGTTSELSIAVGLSGKIAAVGAPAHGNTPQTYLAGGVYIFSEPKGGWKNMTSNVLLTPSNCHYFCQFGSSLAVQGNLVLSGAEATMNYAGAAYIFELP